MHDKARIEIDRKNAVGPNQSLTKEQLQQDIELREAIKGMHAKLEQVSERMPKEPGWIEKLWGYMKWPLIIGGVTVGGYYGLSYLSDYIKNLFEEYSKTIVANALEARTQVQQANPVLGQTTTLDYNTIQQQAWNLLSDGISGINSMMSSEEFQQALKKYSEAPPPIPGDVAPPPIP